jgi:hypothetical protein
MTVLLLKHSLMQRNAWENGEELTESEIGSFATINYLYFQAR